MAEDVRVPLPGFAGDDGDPSSLLAAIRRWATSAPLRELVAASGGHMPEADDSEAGLGRLVVWLDEFSGAHWDFRQGAERNLRQRAHLPEALVHAVERAAVAMGLTDEWPPRLRAYDHLIILGGLLRGCVLRAQRAAALLADGLRVGTVAGVGSFRPLNEGERLFAQEAGLEAGPHEAAAMEAALGAALGLGPPIAEEGEWLEADPNCSWLIRRHRAVSGLPVDLVAAPSSDPGRRANTADNFSFWEAEVGRVGRGTTVLVLTSSLYVPFQHLEAVRVLAVGRGAVVETIGVDPMQAKDTRFRLGRDPATLLQEVRSAVVSLRRLHDAVAAAPR